MFFSGWQKHLRFFRAWHPFFLIYHMKSSFFTGCHPRKSQGLLQPGKIGYILQGTLQITSQGAEYVPKKWLPAWLLYNIFVSDRVMKIISCSNFGSATNAFIRVVEFQDKSSKPKLISQLAKQKKVFKCFNTCEDFQTENSNF